MRIMTYKDATLEALAEEMRRDPSVYVMAEDLHGRGGGLSHYLGLPDLLDGDTSHMLDAPISETAIVASAVGAALAGMRPVIDMRFSNCLPACMDELVNQVYLAQIKEKDAQLQAMQAYINPHFLYNTLDTICWMSRMEDAQETCNLIEALSKLFRMSARDTRKVISVEQELEYINSYIMIQECRHTDFIQFEVQAQEETLKCQTVRFILQPLVENAILHGLEPTGRPGKLSIDIRRQEDKLVMTVEDDGMGADIEELRELLQSHPEGLRGMGISNVNDRIRLCFGEEYGIFFYNAEGGGLRVQAVQPFRQMGEQK